MRTIVDMEESYDNVPGSPGEINSDRNHFKLPSKYLRELSVVVIGVAITFIVS